MAFYGGVAEGLEAGLFDGVARGGQGGDEAGEAGQAAQGAAGTRILGLSPLSAERGWHC